MRAQLIQVEESRGRIVAAGDEQRRRIERDLHDGAQQRLVALALELVRAAAPRRPTWTPTSSTFSPERSTELQVAVSELRELAHGIHPAILTEEGLAGRARVARGAHAART